MLRITCSHIELHVEPINLQFQMQHIKSLIYPECEIETMVVHLIHTNHMLSGAGSSPFKSSQLFHCSVAVQSA